jgi:hypothetical protein
MQILWIFLSLVILIITYYFCDLPDKEYAGTEYVQHYDLETIHQKAPVRACDYLLGYKFGRYRTPVHTKNMHSLTAFQTFTQLKAFAYTSITDNENWFIGSALLQFNYNGAVIVYVYNLRTNESYITQKELPLVSMAGIPFFDPNSSAINGCVNWKKGVLGFEGTKCYNVSTGNYDVFLAGKFPRPGPTYEISYSISTKGEAMSMIFPIGPNRPSLVTKFAGTTVSNALLKIGKTKHQFDSTRTLGMMDWTKGLLRRVTYWHWLAMSWSAPASDGTSSRNFYGLQLSEGTYDNDKNVSYESTLWINHKAYHVNSQIIFTQVTPGVKAFESNWTVQSVDRAVDLTFSFGNVIKGSFHYGIIDGDLFHMWGLYSGTINHQGEIIPLKNVPGTLEDHYALW